MNQMLLRECAIDLVVTVPVRTRPTGWTKNYVFAFLLLWNAPAVRPAKKKYVWSFCYSETRVDNCSTVGAICSTVSATGENFHLQIDFTTTKTIVLQSEVYKISPAAPSHGRFVIFLGTSIILRNIQFGNREMTKRNSQT